MPTLPLLNPPPFTSAVFTLTYCKCHINGVPALMQSLMLSPLWLSSLPMKRASHPSSHTIAIVYWIKNFHQHSAHTTPFYMPIISVTPGNITLILITHFLCLTAASIATPFGILPDDISAHSLHSGSSMALLCVKVNKDQICLFGTVVFR